MRKRFSVPMFAAVLAVTSMADAQSPNPPAPAVRPAIDGILAAFEKHPLVGLGDMHGMAQQEDFFVTLITGLPLMPNAIPFEPNTVSPRLMRP
jgi:hypothetical protein